jgi:copper chaperone NosL
MKRFLILLSFSFLFVPVVCLAGDQVEAPKSCQRCGMDRTVFAQSRMVVVYSEGERVGTCSLHCAATELKGNSGRKVSALQVADCRSRALIDAKTAVWVIGGEKSGVMTELPKWAFAKKEDADAFLRVNGGKIATFDEAMVLAVKEQD